MAGFIRRFTFFPQLSTITEVEGVVVVDLIPPGIFVGLTTGTVCLVGEWPKGPFNQSTVVQGDRTIQDTFGGFSLSVTNPLGFATNPFSQGNAFTWLKAKRFRKLVLVRAKLDLVLTGAVGVNVQLTGTVIDPATGAAVTVIPTGLSITIPAGTRVRDASIPTVEFAISADLTFVEGTDLGSGTSTVFDPDTATYTTRTVGNVPIYSTQGVVEGTVGDVDSVDAQDLFRAGIGAQTGQPSLLVGASTALLDGAAANTAVLTPLTLGQIDTAYENAIDASKPGDIASNDIVIITSARESSAIRSRLNVNARDSSEVGRGRMALNRPPVGTDPTTGGAQAAADPGVGANRSDRVIYAYPHFEQRIGEIAELDPTKVISGANILLGADSAMATILSNLPPENNPGQSTAQIVSGGLLSFIRKLEDGLTGTGLPTKFTISDFKAFKAAGIAALFLSPELGEFVFLSGVTSVLPTSFPQLAPIKRRRMSDLIQDSLAAIALKFNKLPGTVERFDALVGELTDLLETLLSSNNPAQQRIAGFSIDIKSGNTQELQALGIRVIVIKVRLLDTLDHLVLQIESGESVTILAAA